MHNSFLPVTTLPMFVLHRMTWKLEDHKRICDELAESQVEELEAWAGVNFHRWSKNQKEKMNEMPASASKMPQDEFLCVKYGQRSSY